jgi:HPt (histidine-containing phosphotransfer) domain-containing protein
MRQSIAAGDSRRLRRLAHGLKGSSSAFGLTAIRGRAEALEQLAAAGGVGEEAVRLLGVLEQECRETDGFLREQMVRLRGEARSQS